MMRYHNTYRNRHISISNYVLYEQYIMSIMSQKVDKKSIAKFIKKKISLHIPKAQRN